MPLKLYHVLPRSDNPGSHNALKVIILLRELRLAGESDLQIIDVDPQTELHPADAKLRELNPNGLTPIIDDDGFILWESSAVLQYLASTRPGSELLYPADPQQRALVQKWLGWDASTLTARLMNAFFADEQLRSAALEALQQPLSILNKQLAGKDFVLGEYSLADIALGCIACATFMTGVDLTEQTNVIAWLARLSNRDTWQDPIFQNDMATARGQGYAL